VNWGNVPSARLAVAIGGRMLFSPSACFGGTAAPVAWHLAVTEDGPLFLRLGELQEPARAACADPGEYQHQGELVAGEQPMTQAVTGEFCGWAKGIAASADGSQVQAVTEQPGADLQPPLTGPLLPWAGTAGPGPAWPCGACLRVGCPRCLRRPRLSGLAASAAELGVAGLDRRGQPAGGQRPPVSALFECPADRNAIGVQLPDQVGHCG
jgi:hypothetical protein